jgi:hypothetical protein
MELCAVLKTFSNSPRPPNSHHIWVYGFSFSSSCSGLCFTILPLYCDISECVASHLTILSFIDSPQPPLSANTMIQEFWIDGSCSGVHLMSPALTITHINTSKVWDELSSQKLNRKSPLDSKLSHKSDLQPSEPIHCPKNPLQADFCDGTATGHTVALFPLSQTYETSSSSKLDRRYSCNTRPSKPFQSHEYS